MTKDKTEKSLKSGYISRNEKRFDGIETDLQKNFGKIEELENRLDNIENNINIQNQSLEMRFQELSEEISNLSRILLNKNTKETSSAKESNFDLDLGNLLENNNENKTDKIDNATAVDDEIDIKKKYENAIKLLWSNEYDDALKELLELRDVNPTDLMPNIQYWLGEVHYARKDFEKAIIEFGTGLKDYPESIKGPDNMLKLGLSFSNIKKKIEACNVLIELQLKYPDASKNVLQRAGKGKEKVKLSRRVNSIKILKNQFFEVFFSETKIKLENEKIGIAFSGGSDSLALLFLLHKFSKKNNFQIISMIVDHGLREDSKSESIQAKKISEDIGVKAEIYRWNGIKPGSALMRKARDIRYELLLEGCNNLGIKKLCLAHNFDDQIETYYMRKKKKFF